MKTSSESSENPEILQERLIAALHASHAGTWKWHIADDRIEWDEPLARVYGIDIARAPRKAADFLALVHPDDRAQVTATIQAALARESDVEYEFRILHPDGTVHWIYDRSKVVRDAAGNPLHMIGACLDITRRRRSEQALIDSETRLELAAAAADLGIWDWDLRTNEMVYTERAKAIFGFPLDAPVTFEMVRNATHPEDLPRTSAMARRALDPAIREREAYDYRVLRPDGSVRWVLAHGYAVFENISGVEKPVRYVGTIQDVTRRRQTRRALRDSEARLRLAMDAGRMAVWEFDIATETMVGSPELNRLLGYPEDATPSRDDIRAGYYPGEHERVRAAGQEALARGDKFFEVEFRYIRTDSSIRWFLLRAEIVLAAAGTPERVVGVILDVTRQKRAIERQQLLINELNHRVKNSLATVQSITAQTLRHTSNMTQAQSNIERRLLALSHAHDLLTEQGWERARIVAIVERAVAAFVSDRSRLSAEGPDVWLTPKASLDLAMVLQELVTNAMKYGALSGTKGNVTISWAIENGPAGDLLALRWQESDGPPVREPKRTGFGSRLIRALAAEDGGKAHLRFDKTGVSCALTFALPPVQTTATGAQPRP